MSFYSVQDYAIPEIFWNDLRENGQVLLTNNDKQSMLAVDVTGMKADYFEEVAKAIRGAMMGVAVRNMRAVAEESGFMTLEEINAEIALARKEREEKNLD
jgi:hypothetical protein